MSEPVHLWDSPEAAAAWQRGASLRAAWMRVPTELMLDLAGLQLGDRVLDVAAGSGEQSLAAAHRVGPTGSVLATDLSAAMLDVATREARAAKIDTLETLVGNTEELQLPPLSFDAAISRNGLMFMPNLARALRVIYTALKPDKRLAAIVWSEPERNPYTTVPQDVVRRLRPDLLERSGLSRAFALAAPGAFEAALAAAGFAAIQVQRVPIERRFASAAALVQALRTTFSPLASMVQSLDADTQERAWAEVERDFRPYEGPAGCIVPGETLVGAGQRPLTA